jgi:hypothetical protein
VKAIKSKQDEIPVHVAHMMENRRPCMIYVWRPKGREYNIKMVLKGGGWESLNWICLVQEDSWQAHINAVLNLQVP